VAVLAQVWRFLRARKRFWLPVLVISLLFGALLLLSESNALVPFTYRRL
jgi:hypothetical protein